MAFHTLEMNLGLLSEVIYSGRPKLWNTWLKSSSAVVFRPEGDEVSLPWFRLIPHILGQLSEVNCHYWCPEPFLDDWEGMIGPRFTSAYRGVDGFYEKGAL